MGRDHSIQCEVCGMQSGGLNDYICGCDRNGLVSKWETYLRMELLAANLTIAAGLQTAYELGIEFDEACYRGRSASAWRPGCGRPAIDAAREGES